MAEGHGGKKLLTSQQPGNRKDKRDRGERKGSATKYILQRCTSSN
jgi:hypothetical protein